MKLIIDTKKFLLNDLTEDIMDIIEERYDNKLEIYPLLKVYQMLAKGTIPIQSPKGTVTITVKAGFVSDISPLPPGWDYEINDLDSQEEETKHAPSISSMSEEQLQKEWGQQFKKEDTPALETEAPLEVVDINDLKDWKKCGLCGECRWRNTCIGPVTPARRCPGNVPMDSIPDDSKDGDLDQFEHGDPE